MGQLVPKAKTELQVQAELQVKMVPLDKRAIRVILVLRVLLDQKANLVRLVLAELLDQQAKMARLDRKEKQEYRVKEV
jgi:hypothetical protein